jgi:hypothetical protein
MRKQTRLEVAPVVLMVLLALVISLFVDKRKPLTAEEVEDGAVQMVTKLEHTAVRDVDAAVAFLALLTLFVFLMWTALRADGGEYKSTRESNGSGPTSL